MLDIRKIDRAVLSVSPSLLAADFGKLDSEIARVRDAGAELLHLDVMDGVFVPNISFGVPVIKSIRKAAPEMVFDVHLMICRPARYAEAFAGAGADHITFHVESDDNVAETIAAIRATGCTVGISLKPGTPAEEVFPWLDQVDLVLVMTVEPGFGGQSYMADMMPKAKAIFNEIKRRNLSVHLEADGGIDRKTVWPTAEAGVNMLVAGTSVFGYPEGASAAVAELRKANEVLLK